MKKKLVMVMVALMLLIPAVTAMPEIGMEVVQAAEAYTDGTVTYTFDDGTLTVSGNGTVETSEWLRGYAKQVKKLVIKDGITDIDVMAFANGASFSNMESVEIADSVKSIGQQAFYGSRSLKNLKLGKGSLRLVMVLFIYVKA